MLDKFNNFRNSTGYYVIVSFVLVLSFLSLVFALKAPFGANFSKEPSIVEKTPAQISKGDKSEIDSDKDRSTDKTTENGDERNDTVTRDELPETGVGFDILLLSMLLFIATFGFSHLFLSKKRYSYRF